MFASLENIIVKFMNNNKCSTWGEQGFARVTITSLGIQNDCVFGVPINA